MTLSAPQLASSLPSVFQPTSSTWCVWPSNALMNLPSGIENALTNLSAAHVASLVPSGLKQTPNTVSLWPFLMSATAFHVAVSNTLISPSSVGAPPPVAPADTAPGVNDLAALPVRVMAGLVFFAVKEPSSGFFPPEPGQPYSGTVVTDIACNWKVCLEHLLGSQGTSEPEFAWFWPLLVVRRCGPALLVEQVVPHTFLRTRLFTHVYGGAIEAQKFSAAATKEACERAQAERAGGAPAEGGALVAEFHRQLDEAYAGSS